mgnify:FL=1
MTKQGRHQAVEQAMAANLNVWREGRRWIATNPRVWPITGTGHTPEAAVASLREVSTAPTTVCTCDVEFEEDDIRKGGAK